MASSVASASMSLLPAMSALPTVSAPQSAFFKERETNLHSICYRVRHWRPSPIYEVVVMMLHHRQVTTEVVAMVAVVVWKVRRMWVRV